MHRIVLRIAVVWTIALAGACARDSTPPASTSATPAAADVAHAGYQGELPPLPAVQFASARPAPLTRAAYEFAARHPDVLRHVPCFCGCERHGHGNNEDCFVASRERDGRPVWSPHGIGCGICIDVAREAARMHAAGASVAEIRAAIDQKYATEYSTHTPTPPVAHSSSPH
ncbi:MAG TPA: PCYCGC motif-containing (lipo)protein [Vicinamibacterales bacterium]|nr:PCYCGC motif-containing (lipo)protein [Vicinamibacterales bacterium]